MYLKKILWRLSASFVAQMILTPASFAATYEVTPNMRSCAVVRKSNSMRSAQLDCLRAGTDVRILKYNPGGYSQISLNGKKRYVWTRFLKPVKEPVVASKPPVAKPPVVKPPEVKPETPPAEPPQPQKPAEPVVQQPPPAADPVEPVVQQSTDAAAAAETVPATSVPAEEIKPASEVPSVAPTNESPPEVQAVSPTPQNIEPSEARPEEVVAQEVAEPPPPTEAADASATRGPAPTCGGNKTSSPDMWSSVASIAKEGIIPPKQTYDINGSSWPKLLRQGDKLVVEYGPNKKSMCTSATATAFYKHIADLVNSGAFTLTDEQLELLNRKGESRREVKAVYNKKTKKTRYVSTGKIIKPSGAKTGIFKNALNGDTNSMALLYQALGGSSVSAIKGRENDRSKIIAALKMAKPGDIMKIDHRTNGKNYGHSTIFKEVKGDKVCYWSSSPRTNGAAEDCKPIANLTYVAVSRLPADVCEIPKRLDQLLKDPGRIAEQLHSSNAQIAPNWIAWKSHLPNESDSTRVIATEEGEAGGAR